MSIRHTLRVTFFWALVMLPAFSVISMAQNAVSDLPSEYGTSSRTIALGGIEGFSSDAYAIFENPAALTSQEIKPRYSMFYKNLADGETSYFLLAACFPVGPGFVGVGISQKKSPDLDNPITDSNGDFIESTTFAVTDSLYKLGYSQPLMENVRVGASLQYLTQDFLITQGSGWNSDVGVEWDLKPVQLSVVAKNFIGFENVSYTSGYTTLNFPSETVLGARYEHSKSLSFLGQIRGSANLKALGVQYCPIPFIALNMGWREVQADDIQGEISLGVSLLLSGMSLHASYQKSEVIDHDSLYGMSVDLSL